jgi:hypothetical protein
MSKHSKQIDEFYATSLETARWLISELGSRFELRGKTALEPCVGGFVFPTCASELNWTTNDINVWTDQVPDTQCDFLKSDFGRFDFVITNPPFGSGNKLAFDFLKKSAELTDVIAMVVPSSMGELTPRLHRLMPLDFDLVFAEKCPSQLFNLPDGTRRSVRTHGVIWERTPGFKRNLPKKAVLDTRTPFLEFCKDGEFAVRVYGDGLGDTRPWDNNCSGSWARFNCRNRKQIVALKLMMSFPWRYFVGSSGGGRAPWEKSPGVIPTVSTSKLIHYVNCLAVLEGRLDPLEGVDYDEFLRTYTDQILKGLVVPVGEVVQSSVFK